jgi:hypothetical protein
VVVAVQSLLVVLVVRAVVVEVMKEEELGLLVVQETHQAHHHHKEIVVVQVLLTDQHIVLVVAVVVQPQLVQLQAQQRVVRVATVAQARPHPLQVCQLLAVVVVQAVVSVSTAQHQVAVEHLALQEQRILVAVAVEQDHQEITLLVVQA